MNSVVLPNPGEETYGTAAALDASAFGQCLNGVASVIMLQALSGFPDERVHIRWNPYLRTDSNGKVLDKLPCIIVSPPSIRPDNSRGSNSESACHFLVMITIHRAGGRDGINQMGACLRALQEIYRAFSKRAARDSGFVVDNDGAALFATTIDSCEALNMEAWRKGLLVQFLMIDCLLRLPHRDDL